MRRSLTLIMVLLPIFFAENAWAWGPAAHLNYGLAVLEQLKLLSDAMRMLLASEPLAFLYGCISADIVLAKRLGRAATHCHTWENGLRLIDRAVTPRTKAFAFGYVAHLAADTISHNCYVPSKSIQAYKSKVSKHFYWEMVFDKKVTTPGTLRLFKEIAKGDFSDCDEHLDRQIPTRLFDFSTNKRIFNQLLRLQSLKQWQFVWKNLSRIGKWPLTEEEVSNFSRKSMEAVWSFLRDGKASPFLKLDPTGADRLRTARALRRFYKSSQALRREPAQTAVGRAAADFGRQPFHPIDTDEHRQS